VRSCSTTTIICSASPFSNSIGNRLRDDALERIVVERIVAWRGGIHVRDLDDDGRTCRQPILSLAAVADAQSTIDPSPVVALTDGGHDVSVDDHPKRGEYLKVGNAIELSDSPADHGSVFVPLAKWPMLIAGNYRCIRREEMIPIKDAVHGDAAKSRTVYDWVSKLCHRLGAEDEDLVPFEKYAKAAEDLGKPSSAARALFGGAEHIERVDCLVRHIATQQGLQSETLDEIVTLVDERLGRDRAAVLSR